MTGSQCMVRCYNVSREQKIPTEETDSTRHCYVMQRWHQVLTFEKWGPLESTGDFLQSVTAAGGAKNFEILHANSCILTHLRAAGGVTGI